jgi:hypothetical protein
MILLLALLSMAGLCGVSQERPLKITDYVGEAMHYKLKYGIFKIGSASISCIEDPSGCGIQIVAVAQSDGLAQLFRNLHYHLESCMDPGTGLPNHAIINFKDRNTISYNELSFDRRSRTDSTIIFSQISGKHVVSNNMHDILSGFYHFRMNYVEDHTKNGAEVVIKTFHPDKLWDQGFRYAGEETVQTAYGELVCQKYNPRTVVGKYFRNPDDMSVWFTKEEFHIPVKIHLNLKIGAIHGELVEYKRAGIK